MKNIFIVVMAMVMVVMVGCQKEDPMDGVSRSNVAPADPVHDTIPVHDTTIIYHTDTLRIDSIAEGVTRIIVDIHLWTGDWQVSGWNATINATHQIKTLVSENGNVFTEDSVVFTEVGTMSWTFQSTYTVSIDGPHNADANGCPDLQATCTRSWTYNVPAEYASYFVGNCEQIPYLVVGNGNLVTVKTTNGHEPKQATFTVNVNIPGPQITDVTASCSHNTWGSWYVTGNGIKIDGTNTVIETTYYDNGTSAVTGNDTYNCSSLYTFTTRPLVYDHAIDGTYPVIGNTVADLGISMTHTHNHDNPIVNGHNYSNLAPDCDLEIYQVTVVGNNITLNGRGLVNGEYVYRNYSYTVTINLPTPADTVDIFNGQIKYAAKHYSAVDYFCPASGDGWYWLVITEDNQWYTSPDATTAAGLNFTSRGTLSASDYAHIIAVSNFTAPSKSGNRKCAAWCRNTSAGATANVISTVEYDPNGGNPQLKYRNMSGSLIGACSAATGTIATQSVPEPVAQGGIKTGTGVFTFTLGGDVVK